jgi:hypothetical protein
MKSRQPYLFLLFLAMAVAASAQTAAPTPDPKFAAAVAGNQSVEEANAAIVSAFKLGNDAFSAKNYQVAIGPRMIKPSTNILSIPAPSLC